MNSIYFNEEHRILRDQARRFVANEIVPYGEEWERAGRVPRSTLRRMGELGFFGLRFPERLGGSGLDVFAMIVLAEEFGRSTFGGVTVTVMVHSAMSSPHLVNIGTEEQIRKYLPGILSGETICGIAVSEPDAGSDVAGIRTHAERDSDGWRLNGSKMYISNGCYGDLFFVAAKTDINAPGAHGISLFLVEKDYPGFRVGRKLEKFGDYCSDTAELVFENCRVPAENLLGEENRGFYAVMQNFQNERLALGAMATSEATKALELTLDHVHERRAYGAPLAEKQVIRQRLAMLQCKVAAARQLLYYAAWLDAQGYDCVADISMVKALCPEVANEVMYTCQQFHGGMGYLRETVIERMVRDARLHAIGGGATEVMLDEIAKRWN
ncbi:acyl-CoA dehydrogenase [Candidatus Poribacteria bacterium]|jgi:acyl-CoA dehydrogenase|nr:acyl-CoA dehydrogenase [Candidatus Poribacteria bacterium]MDP7517373.1 acyl-CoA dehydrogenase family protein [Arenicellales bacterium]|tara:strand:+ start:7212 stop:8357 length:1146 start_codon:yes stop_codon:yes gene_type:complete